MISLFYRISLLILLSGLTTFHASAQVVEEAAHSITVTLDTDATRLVLHGSTNVNQFSCEYNGSFEPRQVTVVALPDANGWQIDSAGVSLEVKAFDCGHRKMNSDFYELLQYREHPQLHLQLLKLTPSDSTGYFRARASFRIAGKRQAYPIMVENAQQKSYHLITGQHALDIREFGLEPPRKFFGMVVVDETITIAFQMGMRLDSKAETESPLK